jgi:Mn2+/Fe2+ NRAMP family transporter
VEARIEQEIWVSPALLLGYCSLYSYRIVDKLYQYRSVKALVYSAVIKGVVAVPLLFIIMRISNNKSSLKQRTNSRFLNVLGWTPFVVMTVSVVIIFATWNRTDG